MSNWLLGIFLHGGKRIIQGRSNAPGVRDLKSMIAECDEWQTWYENEAKKHRERAAKLELIGDPDAVWEKRRRDDAEESVAKCAAAKRVLAWAAEEIERREVAKAA